MHARSVVINTICLAAGLLVGIGTDFARSDEQEERSPAPTTATAQAAPRCPPPVLLPDGSAPKESISLVEIRSVIREELRAELASYRPRPDEPEDEIRQPDMKTAEQQRLAYDKANQVLRSAIGYGTWTQEDLQQFRGTLHELTVPQQDQLIGELFSAIQSGRLSVKGGGPPL